MSGGHWNYCGDRISLDIECIAEDAEVIRRFPRLASTLHALASALRRFEHDLDWDFSGDSKIADDDAFEKQALGRLIDCVLIRLPDAWFPRGKWATIQAFQERSGFDPSTTWERPGWATIRKPRCDPRSQA